MLGRVETLTSHPIRRLFDAGGRVPVNIDDWIMLGQRVWHEFVDL